MSIAPAVRRGVALNQRGYIQVDDQLGTNVPGIYALHVCNGRGAFTHTATITKLSPPIFWMVTSAVLATVSQPTLSILIRRWAEPE